MGDHISFGIFLVAPGRFIWSFEKNKNWSRDLMERMTNRCLSYCKMGSLSKTNKD